MGKSCTQQCLSDDKPCENKPCRNWIDYKDDFNCSIIAADAHGPMTLDEVSKRMGLSLVRIMQIEEKALVKMKKRMKEVADI
jgi:hypothetical protein